MTTKVVELTEDQEIAIKNVAKFWRGFLNGDQRNVILTAERKVSLELLILVAEELLAAPPASSPSPPELPASPDRSAGQ